MAEGQWVDPWQDTDGWMGEWDGSRPWSGGGPYEALLLMHMDNDLADSSTGDHGEATAVNGAALSSGRAKFGPRSLLLSSASSQYITYPADDDWDLLANGEFCIEAWIYLDVPAGNQRLVQYGNGAPGDRWLFTPGRYGTGSGELIFGIQVGGVFVFTLSGGAIVGLGAWHHVAVSRDSLNIMRLFLDGAIQASGPCTISNSFSGTLSIGAGNSPVDDPMNGSIDELVIRAEATYTAPFTPPTRPY